MGIFDFLGSNKKVDEVVESEPIVETKSNSSYSDTASYGISYPIITKKWDGEKTPGELGVIIKNLPDYQRIRLRAYDAEMKIDSINIILGRYFKWIIGSGLKLQSEPNKTVLTLEGLTSDLQTFSTNVEARFTVWANSKYPDFSQMGNLHDKAMDVYSTSFLGGDCLVVCRIDNNGVNVQVIDGQHIQTPTQTELDEVKTRGNYEQNGIEFDPSGKHVAYFVKVKDKDSFFGKYDRITAYGEKSKRKLAWMVYGSKHRIDHTRGISRISHILEKINKLDRYTEATVSKAEQSANIVFTIKHHLNATGENPLNEIMQKKLKVSTTDNVDSYALADGLSNKITQTTSNQTFNLPPGSELVPHESNSENNFEAFYKAVFSGICASVGMPPEVAMQEYNSNYSASRAAINGWGFVVDIDRKKLADDFYKPVYALWLEVQVLTNKISADGYIQSLKTGDYMVTESYNSCRFIGKNMPHIDPLKEIKAIREMLGENDKTPLISREQATEALNLGEWNKNYTDNQKEEEIIIVKDEQNGNTQGNVIE